MGCSGAGHVSHNEADGSKGVSEASALSQPPQQLPRPRLGHKFFQREHSLHPIRELHRPKLPTWGTVSAHPARAVGPEPRIASYCP